MILEMAAGCQTGISARGHRLCGTQLSLAGMVMGVPTGTRNWLVFRPLTERRLGKLTR